MGTLTVSYHLAIFGVHWSSASEDITYLICHITLQRSCNNRHNSPLKVSHHAVDFGGCKYCGSWNVFVTWSCKTMWSEGHMTLWAEASQGKSHSANFVVNRHCGSRYILVLVYHVILQDYMIKGLSNFVGSSPLR